MNRIAGEVLGYSKWGSPRWDRLAVHVLLLVIAVGVWR